MHTRLGSAIFSVTVPVGEPTSVTVQPRSVGAMTR